MKNEAKILDFLTRFSVMAGDVNGLLEQTARLTQHGFNQLETVNQIRELVADQQKYLAKMKREHFTKKPFQIQGLTLSPEKIADLAEIPKDILEAIAAPAEYLKKDHDFRQFADFGKIDNGVFVLDQEKFQTFENAETIDPQTKAGRDRLKLLQDFEKTFNDLINAGIEPGVLLFPGRQLLVFDQEKNTAKLNFGFTRQIMFS